MAFDQKHHFPYLPGLAAFDFYLFKKRHFPMKDMRYADGPAIQTACINILSVTPPPPNNQKSSFEVAVSRANQCIAAEVFVLISKKYCLVLNRLCRRISNFLTDTFVIVICLYQSVLRNYIIYGFRCLTVICQNYHFVYFI